MAHHIHARTHHHHELGWAGTACLPQNKKLSNSGHAMVFGQVSGEPANHPRDGRASSSQTKEEQRTDNSDFDEEVGVMSV